MNLQDLLYFIIGAGFAAFLVGAVNGVFRHGWHWPHNCFSVMFLYGALACLFDVPSLSYYYYHYDIMAFLIGSVDICMAPLSMLVLCSLCRDDHRVKLVDVVVNVTPFVLYQLSVTVFVNMWFEIGSAVLVCVITYLWCRSIWRNADEYLEKAKDFDSNPSDRMSRWMRSASVIVATLIFLFMAIKVFNLGETIVFRVFLDILVYLPLLFVMKTVYDRNVAYEEYEKEPDGYASDLYMPKSSFPQAPAPTPVATALDTEAKAMGASSPSKPPVSQPSPIPHAAPSVDVPADTQTPLANTTSEFLPDDSEGFLDSSNIPAAKLVVYEKIRKSLSKLEDRTTFYLDSDLTVGELAKRLNTNRTYLSNYFRDCGTSFFDYIESHRVAYAAMLLEQQPSLNAEAVAFRSGFGSRAAFYRAFNNYYHTTPSEYRSRFEKK